MLGIMSGRLSPKIDNCIQAFPHHSWEKEFSIAKSFGFQVIEWIYEDKNKENNPILSKNGTERLLKLSKEFNISLNSIVLDNLMVEKLYGDPIKVQNTILNIERLLISAYYAKIRIVELPLMGKASLVNDKNRIDAIRYLKYPIKLAEALNITLVFELDLAPKTLLSFIKSLSSKNVGINYDMGNSAIFGFDPSEEIETYGDFIKNVHIKDGVFANSTVPLGNGDTNFDLVFALLKKHKYNGDFILQCAREDLDESDPKRKINDTIRDYLIFLQPKLDKFYN